MKDKYDEISIERELPKCSEKIRMLTEVVEGLGNLMHQEDEDYKSKN